jgi:Fe(II)/alpha-ketoglutarate-dependent arginine beta-hydroxylase
LANEEEKIMDKLVLSDQERTEVRGLIDEIIALHGSAEATDFLVEANVFAHMLPLRVRRFLNAFRSLEPSFGACVLSGYEVDDRRIGKTPGHWKGKPEPPPTAREEVFLVLLGSLLGEVFGWFTQQDAHIVHDIIPLAGQEHAQLETGSEELILWHNEDAFHPYRCDYLALLCMRNLERAATTLFVPDLSRLTARQREVLREPRFVLMPDDTHLLGHNPGTPRSAVQELAYRRIVRMIEHPEGQALLYGAEDTPYMRLDPCCMSALPGDEEASEALDALIRTVGSGPEVVLQPGDVLFVDNYRVVHGRKPFTARYDGTDRWLKRIGVTRDLRKSRAARETAASRIIY